MQTVNMHEAKTHLSKLIKSVAAGEEITIARSGQPVAKLIPFAKSKKRTLGQLEGQLKVSEQFDAPLPADLLAEFEKSR